MAGRNESNADVSDFLADAVNKETRETALYIEQELVRKAAVRDGFLRGSFIASVGAPDTSKKESIDRVGNSTIDAAFSVIATAKPIKYPTIYVQSNLPYSYKIMELGYSKKQTPPKTLSLVIQAAVNK